MVGIGSAHIAFIVPGFNSNLPTGVKSFVLKMVSAAIGNCASMARRKAPSLKSANGLSLLFLVPYGKSTTDIFSRNKESFILSRLFTLSSLSLRSTVI